MLGTSRLRMYLLGLGSGGTGSGLSIGVEHSEISADPERTVMSVNKGNKTKTKKNGFISFSSGVDT